MTGIERLRDFVGGISPITVVCGVTKTSYDREHMEEAGVRLRDFLADIADQIERESDVETVRSDAMRAWEWVREHGGLEAVRRMFQDADNRRVELCGALGVDLDKGWSEAMAAMRLRLMPEGCEWLIEAWPKFEDDAPVKLGDMALIDGDADMVEAVQIWIHGKPVIYGDNGSQQLEKGERVRRPAVPAGDGEPLKVGQTVWDVDGYGPLVVTAVPSKGEQLVVLDNGGTNFYRYPEKLTHKRPDSWERIEDDATLEAATYCERMGIDVEVGESFVEPMASDLVRRCRALAERERGER